MTDEKNNDPRSQTSMNSFPEPKQFRKQAEQLAKDISLPDFGTMTHEEIQQQFRELRIKQIEAELQNEQLRTRLEERHDQAKLFRIVTENMLDMVALTDMEGNFIFAGKSHEILGYGPGFLIGKNVMDFVHPEDLPHIQEEFGESVASGHPRRVEYRYRCKDGTYIWLETIGNFIKDENGIPQEVVFSSRDITGRKKAEEELYKNEAMTQALLNGIPESAFLVESDGTIIAANTPVAQRLSCTMEELIGSNIFTRVSDGVAEYRRKFFDQVLQTGQPVQFEDVRLDRDIENRINPILDQDGKVTRLAIVGIDITERKRAEKALRESEDRFQKMLSLVPDMISIHDTDMNIIYSNWNGVGAVSEEKRVLNTKCYRTYRGYDNICPDCQAGMVMETGKPFQEETKLSDGRWIDLRVFPIPGINGGVELFAEWVRDITEQKHIEEELRKSEKEHRRLFETMNQGVVYQDTNGKIISANPAAERILGLSFDQMKGKISVNPRWRMIKEDGAEVPGTDHPAIIALRTGETVGPVIRGVFHPGRKVREVRRRGSP